jgi:hypothetical protein
MTEIRVHIESGMAADWNTRRASLIAAGTDPALLDPARNEVWQGLVPQMDLEGIFRFFNRVEPGDGERLEALGYDLPSLSTGDLVTVGGKRWRVASVGFEEAVAEKLLTGETEGRPGSDETRVPINIDADVRDRLRHLLYQPYMRGVGWSEFIDRAVEAAYAEQGEEVAA